MKPVSLKLKVKSCENAMLWYSSHVNKMFDALYEDSKAYWTRETEHPFCLNWIYKQDAEIVNQE